jgi:hypothetical protein
MRVRFATLFGSLVLGAVALTGATPAIGATQVAAVTASFNKPLVLIWIQDLDLGTVAPGPGTWSGATVAVSRDGLFSCANANVTCTGATKAAQYQVTGTNNAVARVSAPNVTLVNQADPTRTLLLTIDAPATVTLPNSGQPGTIFSIGGAVTLSSTTASGVYSGTLNVTVDY